MFCAGGGKKGTAVESLRCRRTFVDEDHHVYLTDGMKERFSLIADFYSVEDIAE